MTALPKTADGPLAGVRIVDLTNVIMGPFATHILADLGADVIKIESPEGDLFRHYTPSRHAGMFGSFLHLNRNKRSVMLDLKSPAGRDAMDRLVTTADVFVHALRPKAIASLRYTYDDVRALRSDIVYCGAYGFGADGPYGDKAAYDDLIQAGSGMAHLSEALTGAPSYMPTVICDKLAGQAIANAILAALFHHSRTGEGQNIEVPMFETSVEFMAIEHLGGFAFEPPLAKPGFVRLLSKGRKPYRTRDGYACILPYSDRNWQELFEFVGRSDLAADPQFAKLAERVQHIDVLYAMLEEEAAQRPTAEWVAFCDRVSIPCMPVLSLEELVDDEHLKAVGFFGSAEHPSEGRYLTMRNPVTYSAHSNHLRRHAPRLGEHTAEILAELGSE